MQTNLLKAIFALNKSNTQSKYGKQPSYCRIRKVSHYLALCKRCRGLLTNKISLQIIRNCYIAKLINKSLAFDPFNVHSMIIFSQVTKVSYQLRPDSIQRVRKQTTYSPLKHRALYSLSRICMLQTYYNRHSHEYMNTHCLCFESSFISNATFNKANRSPASSAYIAILMSFIQPGNTLFFRFLRWVLRRRTTYQRTRGLSSHSIQLCGISLSNAERAQHQLQRQSKAFLKDIIKTDKDQGQAHDHFEMTPLRFSSIIRA